MPLREMDNHVTYLQQLQEEDGPVVLINPFSVAPGDTAGFLEAWADDAAFMKQQPGFISAQLHQGTAGSTTFINVAIWESAQALGRAFSSPRVPAARGPLPRQHRRCPARLQEGRRRRHLRRLARGSAARHHRTERSLRALLTLASGQL